MLSPRLRFARAGRRVLLGSRDRARAETAASRLRTIANHGAIEGRTIAGKVQRREHIGHIDEVILVSALEGVTA